jgi:hypothetical protein
VLVSAAERPGSKVATMTIFDSSCRQSRERRRRASGSPPTRMVSQTIDSQRGYQVKPRLGYRIAYGISDGVSGFEPGGGKLMKVGCEGCDMMLRCESTCWYNYETSLEGHNVEERRAVGAQFVTRTSQMSIRSRQLQGR